MRYWPAIIVLSAVLAVWTGCGRDPVRAPGPAAVVPPPPAKLLLSWNFSGGAALQADTNLATFAEVVSLPESRAFAGATFRQLASKVAPALLGLNPTNSAADAGQIQPLLADLAGNPSQFVAASFSNQVAWALGLRLSEDRAAAWLSNAWLMAQPGVRIASAGSWTTVSSTATNNLTESFTTSLSRTNEPDPQTRLEVQVALDNWPAEFRPQLLGSVTNISVSLSAKGDALRPHIVLTTSKPLDFPLTPWQIPTNTIRDPLIGFTAAQGLIPWLARAGAFGGLSLSNPPSQMILWHQALSPFSVTASFPHSDSAGFMDNLVQELLPVLQTNFANRALGQFEYNTNSHRLNWLGLPIVIPFLGPADDTNLLQAGLFPLVAPSGKPAPPELFDQVNSRTNLLYYDWEITQERLAQWRPISQLVGMVANRTILRGDAMSENWMKAVEPKLGNAVTEITLSGPRELTLTRRAPLGLNALEIVALARWVEPFLDLPAPRARAKEIPAPVLPVPAPQ